MSIMDDRQTKVGWRPAEWAADVGISRTSVWRLMKDERIASVAIGRTRIIVTSPAEYLSSLRAPLC